MTPDVVYKHMRAEHADLFLRGRVRVSALAYFRRIEGAPDGIQDTYEGNTVGKADVVSLHENASGDLKRKMARLGQSGTRLILGGTYTLEVPPVFILSFSMLDTLGLFGTDYDRVMAVHGVGELARRILRANPDLFETAYGNRVTYGPTSFAAGVDEAIEPNPWLKNSDLAWEEEFRLVFIPKQPFGVDFLDVEFSPLNKES